MVRRGWSITTDCIIEVPDEVAEILDSYKHAEAAYYHCGGTAIRCITPWIAESEKKWGVSMYDASCALIANYINPIIGDMKIQSITPRVVDKYIKVLGKTPCVAVRTRKPATQFVTDKTIEKIV